MPERTFYEPHAQSAIAAAVKAVEAQTSAEVVVALRRASGWYRAADFLWGAVSALAALVAILLVPASFRVYAVPLDLVVAFALGSFLSASAAPLRRLVVRPRRRREFVRTAARAAFHELGVSRTAGRTGVLVYLSMFEREVEVVPDFGVDVAGMGEGWTGAVESLRSAVRARDFEAFHGAVLALGPVLAKTHPRRADDVNELADEVSA